MITDAYLEQLSSAYRLKSRLAKPLERHHVSLTQWLLLSCLYRDGRQCGYELAEYLGVSGALVTMSCRSLIRTGLIHSTRTGDDQRERHLTLTPAGFALVEVIDAELENRRLP